MTSTGLIVGPIAFALILLPWRFCIAGLVILATLDSAAVVNVGSFGLQPGYFFGLLIIGRTALEITMLGKPLNTDVVRTLRPLLFFVIICFISIWVGLTFFQGKIMVIGSTAGFDLDQAQPYTFQRQNLTQPLYLLLNVGIVYALAHQIAGLPRYAVAGTLDRAILCAILFASAIAMWEMAYFYFSVPFFPDFFHSNAGYAMAHGQVLSDNILRVSGSFAEPSALAYQFAAYLMYAWYRFLRAPGPGAMAVVLLCLTIMAASTSTTAFLVLGLFALVVLKDGVVALARIRSRLYFSLRHLAVLALVLVATLCVLAFIQSKWTEIDDVVTKMLLEKHESSSYAQRSGVDRMAFDVVLQTGGLGIGLGSHKPNNLTMTLLSNTGLLGSLVFAVFLFELLRPRRGDGRILDIRRYRWMLIALLCVHLISNPNLNSLILWISFALVIGAIAVEQAADQRSKARVASLEPEGRSASSWRAGAETRPRFSRQQPRPWARQSSRDQPPVGVVAELHTKQQRGANWHQRRQEVGINRPATP
jgi:hypothetical protein